MSDKFNKIVEIMPDNMPDWMTEALLGGRLAIACMEVIEAQETAIKELQAKNERHHNKRSEMRTRLSAEEKENERLIEEIKDLNNRVALMESEPCSTDT